MSAAVHQPHEVDLAVGMNIRRLRRQMGKSQEFLAEGIGLTFQQVQKYERGANRVSCSVLIAICETLQCSPLDILPTAQSKGGSGFGDWAGEISEVYSMAPGLFEAVAEMNRAEITALMRLAMVMVAGRRAPAKPAFDPDESERIGNAYRNDPRRLEELDGDEMAGAA